MPGIREIEVRRILLGHFSSSELKRYLGGMSIVFWGLIALCWFAYPTENKWWIASHTFSFLGSFSEDRNPTWWWLFSVAMIFWAIAMAPLILYNHRRFAQVSRAGAAVGSALFFIGSIGIVLVALFPDVSSPLIGGLKWTEVHTIVAIICFAGFGLAVIWLGLLLIKDFVLPRNGQSFFRHRHVAGPYLLWSIMVGVATWNQLTWDSMYAEMKAAAAASGQQIRSSWGESLNTFYAFPLWENLLIYTLYIFIVWLALAVPNRLGLATKSSSEMFKSKD